jgi:hypothetical protein
MLEAAVAANHVDVKRKTKLYPALGALFHEGDLRKISSILFQYDLGQAIS